MKRLEAPEYVANQRRSVLRLYRWMDATALWGIVLWTVVFVGFLGATLLDVAFRLGWGHRVGEVLPGLGMLAFGWFLFGFCRMISAFNRSLVDRIYPDSTEDPALRRYDQL